MQATSASTIRERLARIDGLAQSIDTGLWAGRFRAPGTRDVAERAKANLVGRAEQARRILRKRYGVEVK